MDSTVLDAWHELSYSIHSLVVCPLLRKSMDRHQV